MILVTGASGFIGKRLVKFLDKSNIKVRIMSRKPNINFETIKCDFEINQIPASAFDSIDTVYHLAGFSHDMRNASKVKHLYQKINVDTTLQLAKLAVKSGVKRFVFVSSVKAGGCSIAGELMNEEYDGNPEGIYGKTKRDAELKLLEIGQSSNMHVSIVRPALVYGPNAKGNLKLMLSGIKAGWFPPLPEINNRRSMIHVDDLVRAILLIAENNNTNGEIYIATDGNYYSSRKIYELLCSQLGKSVPSWSIPLKLFEIVSMLSPRLNYKVKKLLGDECYSSKKLRSIGFKAKFSLREMNEEIF